MDVFLATQPIFDLHNQIIGHEILYRENEKNTFSEKTDANFASGNALVRCFLNFGLPALTNNTCAFVNFTSEFLKTEVATLFSSRHLVVEILETVPITEEILKACTRLKKRGYKLAIDDFCYQPGYDRLIPLADIVKVDFRRSDPEEQAAIVRKYRRKGLRFLAEKVETQEECDRARKQGYVYFQGYFFAKPSMNRTKKLSSNDLIYMRLINKLNAPGTDLQEIAKLVATDLAFSYQVLRLVNSAFFAPKQPITSVSLAVNALGVAELQKLLYVLFISHLNESKPEELVRMSMRRGRFMEELAKRSGHQDESNTMMTVGMFSLLDVLLDCPMKEAIRDIHFPPEIQNVLLGSRQNSFLSRCYEVTICYEQGLWKEAIPKAAECGISPRILRESYVSAIKWVEMYGAL